MPKTHSLVRFSLWSLLLLSLVACKPSPPFVYLGGEPEPIVPGEDHPCVNFDESQDPELTIAEAIEQKSETQLLREWMRILKEEDPDSYNNLNGAARRTLLAPTNAAIKKFESEFNVAELTDFQWRTLIKHHILIIPVMFEQFKVSGVEVAMNRETVDYQVENEYCVLFEGRARLVEANDKCVNGVIHLIDQVLIPGRGF